MSGEPTGDETPDEIARRIQKVGRYSALSKAGFTIIVGAFLLAVVGVLPSNLDSVPAAVDAILLPLIFVGIGALLLGIGMHLHLMHLNLVRQIRRSETGSGGDTGSGEQ